MNRILALQLLVAAGLIIAIYQWGVNFPYPSPFIKPLLEHRQKYPGPQITYWVKTNSFPRDFLEYFGRDPDRKVPTEPGLLVSGADGFVREIVYENNKSYLMVQLTFWDVHIIRTPISGTITSIVAEGITSFRQDPPNVITARGKIAPTQKIVTLDTEIGEVEIRMITNYWASRVKVWVGHGESLERGQRIGQMLAGSTVVMVFPGIIDFDVDLKQQVYGGESIIARGVGEP